MLTATGLAFARRLSLALFFGVLAASLPWLVSRIGYETLWPINFLMIPGTAIALLISGNVHDYSINVVFVVNTLFYGVVSFLLLRVCGRKANPQRLVSDHDDLGVN